MIIDNRLIINSFIFICLVPVLVSCGGDFYGHRGTISKEKGNLPPGEISNIKIKSLPGGAKIFYNLPQKGDMLYVEAVYKTKSRGKQESKSSLYKNSIIINGFSDTTGHKVKLYSVSSDGNRSKPVTKTIHPLTPPFKAVYNSINIQNAFGGVIYNYSQNETESNLTIHLVQDSSGIILPLDKNHISRREGLHQIYNLKSKNYKIGYFVTDQYENISDTTYVTLNPLFEEELPTDDITFVDSPYDSVSSEGFRNLFDDAATTQDADNIYGPKDVVDVALGKQLPIMIVMNLGAKYKISRIILFGAPTYGQFLNGSLKKFQIWGSLKPDFSSGVPPFSKNWHLLGTFVYSPQSANKPMDSKTPYPQNGISFKVSNPSSLPPIKYFRIRVLTTWSGTNKITIGELKLFGAPF
jgi:hypothetical protein